MTDMQLIPQRTVRLYDITGPCFYTHEGKTVQALELDIEEDPHHPEAFALQVTTASNKVITYRSEDYETWPSVVRRLFRMHTAVRDRRA